MSKGVIQLLGDHPQWSTNEGISTKVLKFQTSSISVHVMSYWLPLREHCNISSLSAVSVAWITEVPHAVLRKEIQTFSWYLNWISRTLQPLASIITLSCHNMLANRQSVKVIPRLAAPPSWFCLVTTKYVKLLNLLNCRVSIPVQ